MTTLAPVGDPGALRSLARSLERDGANAHDAAMRLERAASLPDSVWVGAARDRFDLVAPLLQRATARIAARITDASTVVLAYASELETLQHEGRALIDHCNRLAQAIATQGDAVRQAADRAAAPDAVESDRARLRVLAADLDASHAEAVRLAQLQCELEARAASAVRRALIGLQSVAALDDGLRTRHALHELSDAMVLARLSQADPESRAALVGNEHLVERLRAMPAELVAEWWGALGGGGTGQTASGTQLAVIAAAPAIIGNLDGVAYWARDLANKRSLARELATATEAVDALRSHYADAPAATRPGLARALADALQRWTELSQFQRASQSDPADPSGVERSVVSFHPGPPALGSIALGDLDSAGSVSYLVPGMGTTLAASGNLTAAASNVLWQLQHDGRDHDAVVAWLGYEAPPMVTESLGVLTDAHAVRGAPLLVSDLAALRACRGGASLNVVAHSYGSTLAALALAEHPELAVNTFVALGSAGIPAQVRDAAALGARHVFAVQGAELIAAAGRFASAPHRSDPAGSFGASVIWSGNAGDRGGVSSHNLLVAPHDSDTDSAHGDRHGYLDRGTNSLEGVAAAIAR